MVRGPENAHAFLEWCREMAIGMVFMGEAWIEKNGRGTQTHPNIVLMTTTKKGKTVMTCVRKGMEEEAEVVKEEDNVIILQQKNKKNIGGVYANSRWHGEKWKE